MIYKSYLVSIIVRVLLITASALLLVYGYYREMLYLLLLGGALLIFLTINFYRFAIRRFREMDDFFESVKYRDFSRFFVEQKGPEDLRHLHKGFNIVNKTIRAMNSERQLQFVYLQKILEMVEVGILAYKIEDGNVVWVNDSFLKTLDLPSFKNINFLYSRKPEIYNELFNKYHKDAQAIQLELNQERLKVLVSDTIFQMEGHSFKLIVIQNIEKTLDKNESDAWKKLLSVMTHEIMNSIAPISSLAETLQQQVQMQIDDPAYPLNLEDINDGISSIKNRSKGLMKFAKTYRSLNKVTKLALETVLIADLFKNIEDLMRPTLAEKNIKLQFKQESPSLSLVIDSYLIEQVLINLILNAIEASSKQEQPAIMVSAQKNLRGATSIKVIDNGEGIPEELKEHIFVPFFSTKKTGSGVGLSLCKQIMSLHEGTIQVSSKQGSGSVISLVF